MPDNVPIISMTKGLEASTQKRMTEVISEYCPEHPVGVITGPNLAREILEGKAAASVLALDDPSAQWLQPILNVGLFRTYHNNDVIGCELGGILKNIIAIAVGLGDGLGAGDNTRAALITRGLAEVTRLGMAMGGRPETFAGLAGMGDMIATCNSPQSRNRHVGLELAKGKSVEEITSAMNMVAEGVKSAPTVVSLANKFDVEVPFVLRSIESSRVRQTPRGFIAACSVLLLAPNQSRVDLKLVPSHCFIVRKIVFVISRLIPAWSF